MPKVFFYIHILYIIIFKWNIELLQIFIFELVQYTFYQYFGGGKDIIDSFSSLQPFLPAKYKLYIPKI